MALTGVQLTDEVQAAVGRTDDTLLVDTTRVTRWLNEAQRKIAEECPNLPCLQFNNTDSLDTTQLLQYAVADITVGDSSTDERVCYLYDVFHLDGNESRRLEFIQNDEFDSAWPDATHSDIPKTRPTHWTLRADVSGGYVELMPMCATAYCDDDIRFVGTMYPGELTTEDASASDLENCDELLIAYAVAKAWGYIGKKDDEMIWWNKFHGLLDDKQAKTSRQHQWEGNLFYSSYE